MRKRLLAGVVSAALCFGLGRADAAEGLTLYPLFGCGDGNCSVAVFAGSYLATPMKDAFGTGGFTPVWDWEFERHHLLGATYARRILSYYGLDIEPEMGIAQRFGGMHETEIWGAIYFRWTRFPWNHLLHTTVAISTGLNWATGVHPVEEARSKVPGGSRLMHYLSPEVTFALPARKDIELLFRFHHRSGGGDFLPGEWGLFNGASGGVQFATVGLRHRF